MAITAALVKELRDMTGAGMMDAKKALVETDGNIDKAVDLLREKGLAAAAKKAGRIAAEGVVQSYIHAGGRIGVLVEVNCETDFVAKTDDFQNLARDIAMQIAAVNPTYLNREEVPTEVIEHEKQVLLEQAKVEAEEDVKAGRKPKPEAVLEKMVAGRIEKFYKENCLLEQVFIRKKTMKLLQHHLVIKIRVKIKTKIARNLNQKKKVMRKNIERIKNLIMEIAHLLQTHLINQKVINQVIPIKL